MITRLTYDTLLRLIAVQSKLKLAKQLTGRVLVSFRKRY